MPSDPSGQTAQRESTRPDVVAVIVSGRYGFRKKVTTASTVWAIP
jgi:hypothetical protein